MHIKQNLSLHIALGPTDIKRETSRTPAAPARAPPTPGREEGE